MSAINFLAHGAAATSSPAAATRCLILRSGATPVPLGRVNVASNNRLPLLSHTCPPPALFSPSTASSFCSGRKLPAAKAVDDETTPGDYDRELTGDDVGVTAIVKVEDDAESLPSPDKGIGGIPKDTEDELSGVTELKQQLLDSLYGTDRGLRASSETRGEVLELIAKLEGKNPNAAPTDAESRQLLDGKWILAYTSYSELFPLLAASNLPLVTMGEISQTIDTVLSRFVNAITFSGPVASTTISASASFEVRSPSRLQIKFEEGVVSPPEVVSSPATPDALYLFGQRVPLDPLRPLLDVLRDAAVQVTRVLSGQPPLRFRIGASRSGGATWLLTTFLDDDLRISRGDGGGVFVLTKAGSAFSSYSSY